MTRTLSIICVLVGCAAMAAADTSWLYGRIVDVRKSVNTRTKAWVVNTPITEDEVTYSISVQVQDRVIFGTYELTPEEAPPPDEWTTNYPVKIQIVADRLYVRSPAAELRLHIVRRKVGKMMTPLSADEKKQLEQMDAPAESMVGFSNSKTSDSKTMGVGSAPRPAEGAPQPAPAPLPPTTGSVAVRSTPYLSEVFVDGDSMGYTPAKVSLPPGKHSFRVEKSGYKPWAKEITITVGSELTLDASLEKK